MWSILFSLLALNLSFADQGKQKVVYADCDCAVYNDSGMMIDARALSSLLPVSSPYFSAQGHSKSFSSYEQTNCSVLESGDLSFGCAIPAVSAQANAQFKCGKIAQSYNPNSVRGFTNGQLVAGSCQLDLVEETPMKIIGRSFLDMITGH